MNWCRCTFAKISYAKRYKAFMHCRENKKEKNVWKPFFLNLSMSKFLSILFTSNIILKNNVLTINIFFLTIKINHHQHECKICSYACGFIEASWTPKKRCLLGLNSPRARGWWILASIFWILYLLLFKVTIKVLSKQFLIWIS